LSCNIASIINSFRGIPRLSFLSLGTHNTYCSRAIHVFVRDLKTHLHVAPRCTTQGILTQYMQRGKGEQALRCEWLAKYYAQPARP